MMGKICMFSASKSTEMEVLTEDKNKHFSLRFAYAVVLDLTFINRISCICYIFIVFLVRWANQRTPHSNLVISHGSAMLADFISNTSNTYID